MKILMLCEFFDPKLEFQENQLVKYYRKAGHEVRLLTSQYTNVFDYYASAPLAKAPASEFEMHGAKIYRLPYRFNLLNRIRPYRGVADQLDAFAPDLIYLHDIIPNTGEIARYLRRHPACRAIIDIHMDYSNSGKGFVALRVLHGTIRRWYFNRIRQHLDGIFPIVPTGFDFMREVYGVPDADMTLLPLGADIDLIDEVQRTVDRTALRARYGIPPQSPVIVTGGKITPRKRLEWLIEAIDCTALDDVHVIVLGQIPESEPAYGKLIASLSQRVAGRLHFVGWQEPAGVYAHMAIADLAVFPSSQSIMWQQSIASGLPLIVGDTGGQDASYLNANDNVIVMSGESLDSAGIRQSVSTLLADSGKLRAMADGARKTGREMLDWTRLIDTTLTCLQPGQALPRNNRAMRSQ
ncbi:glycosyltransferase family 4 protein [Sphingomonas sp. SUN039]|uniref:glycosyltransferase family 4 protein n=1 Tax=Sphingomonas sp. SUN039 TaxID=2937787 RepID=UPI0021645556|nr:glycosyltransferase family 4 protein [Sphingomonas sp. SUN039]UVO52843.1 glycosyltransferase family 4 protein [Sphingomonas sp. SUN039]